MAIGGGGSRRRVVPSVSRALALGLTTGAVYFAGTLYWITAVMTNYGGLPFVVAMLVNILFVAYLALYPGFFAAITSLIVRRVGPSGLLVAPAVWVATELGRGRLFTGFPWVLLGYSQAPLLPVAQLASAIGVYGLSAFVAMFSAAGAYLVLVRGRSRYVPAAVAGVLLVTVAVWGSLRIADGRLTREGTAITVGLVQGNVPQDQKWDPMRSGTIFRDYVTLTKTAIAHGARFVVWPEASTPFVFGQDVAGTAQIEALARAAHVTLLIGSDYVEGGQYYNAAIVVRPDGRVGPGVPQDAPGALRRVRAVEAGVLLRRAPRACRLELLGR